MTTLDKSALVNAAAGRRLIAYLTIYNSADFDRLRTFIEDNYTDEALAKDPVETRLAQHQAIYQQAGKLRVHQVVAADDYYVVVLLQAQNGGYYINEFKVSEDYPHKIIKFQHHAAE